MASIAFAAFSTAALAASPSGTWTQAGPLTLQRADSSFVNVGGALYLIGGYVGVRENSTLAAYDPASGSWTYKTPMPTARHGVAAGAIGTTIYVAGGYQQGGAPYLSTVEAYDTLTDSWTAKASMPSAMTAVGSTVYGGKLYSFGGSTGGFCRNYAYAYDPVANSWATLAAMPTTRCRGMAAPYNGKIYVMGGMTTGSVFLSAVEVYDPVANSWSTSTAAALPQGLGYFAAGVSSGTIYAVSGTTNGFTASPYTLAYDPAANAWTTRASLMPSPRFLGAMDAVNGSLYVVTGATVNTGGDTGQIQAYDPAADSWSVPGLVPGARRDAAAVVLSSSLYVLGGQYPDGPTDDVQAAVPAVGSWSYAAPLPGKRIAPAAAVSGGLIYVAGGLTASTAAAATAWSYNPATNAWTALASMPSAGGCGAAAVISGKLYVLNACDGTAGGTTALAAYDLSSGTWASLAAAPHVHQYPVAGVLNGKLYVAGGVDASGTTTGTLDVYDPAAGTWTTGASMATARRGAAGGAVGALLIASGGLDASSSLLTSAEAYDPVADAWSSAPAAPTARSGAASAASGLTVYAAGGAAVAGDTNTVEGFTLAPTLLSMTASPFAATLASGTLQMAATGRGSDGTTSAVSPSWSVDAASVATVGSSGLVTAVGVGTARVTASSGALTASALVTVVGFAPPPLQSITVSPASRTLAAGASQLFTATGRYGDNSTRTLDGTLGAWTRGPDMPQTKIYSAAASVGGKFYVLGGDPAPTTQVYDPATGAWSTRTSPPVFRAMAQATAVGAIIYVYGGCVNSDCSFLASDAWAYDTAADSWTQKASMPAARQGMSADVIGGKIYVAGGYSGGAYHDYTPYAAVTVYDPAADAWTTKASMPLGRGYGGAAAVDGILYYAGGSVTGFDGAPQTDVMAYDPAADSWTLRASLPSPLLYQGSVSAGGKLYMVGGSTRTAAADFTAATWVYDPAANSWSAGPPMNDPRYFPMTATDGTTLFVSGSTSGTYSASFESASLSPLAAWSSDAPSAATVTAAGAATGLSAGTAHIVASSGAVSGSATLTVTPPPVTLTSISVSPSAATVQAGSGQAFAATGHYSDGSTAALGPGAWTRGTNMAVSRVGLAGAVVNGKFYAIGGDGTQRLDVYDPATSSWTALAAPPIMRAVARAAVVGSTIYVVGGCVNSDCTASPSAAVYAYDTSADAWTVKAPLPATRYAMVLDVIGGRIYAAGGYTGNYVLSSALTVYDPATNAWTAKASMPAGRSYAGGGAANGKLYVLGGTNSGYGQAIAPQLDAYEYDPVADSWTTRAPLPDRRAAGGSAALDGKIYVADGMSTSSVAVHGTLVYDAASDSWSAGPATNDQRYDPGFAAGGGTLFVAGPLGPGNTASTSFEVLAPGAGVAWSSDAPSVATVTALGAATGLSAGTAHVTASSGTVTGSATLTVAGPPTLISITVSPSTAAVLAGVGQSFAATAHYSDGSSRPMTPAAWTRGPDMAAARVGLSGAVVNGRFYAIGGDGSQRLDVYDPAASSWTALAPPPVNRAVAGAAVVGGTIYVVGGCINSDCTVSPTAAVWAYDTAANVWTSKASLPAARHGMIVDAIGGKIYAAGGYTGNYVPSSALTVYDPATNAWTTKASMPLTRAYAGGGAAGGKLYVAGGTDNGYGQAMASHAETMAYDPAADSWTLRSSLPDARTAPGSAALDGKIYVVDGNSASTVAAHGTWVYDPAANSWSAGPATNDQRYDPGIAAGNGTLFVAGPLGPGNAASVSFESVVPGSGAAWASDAPSVATVTAAGTATGLAAGTAHVIASSGSVSGTAALTVTAPGLSGTAAGVSSVVWSWPLAPGATGYRVLDSSGSDRSGALGAATTAWLETGLTPNALAVRRLQAVGASTVPYLSPAASRYTWAAPPSGTAAPAVFVSSLTLSWSLNGNAPATLASVERAAASTAAPAFVTAGTTTAVSFTDSGLAACTTYYYRARNANGDGIATAYDSTVSVRTRADAPLPPGGLAAADQSGARVLLTWSASPSPFVTAYRVYVGTGDVDYASPYAAVPSSVTQFVTPALSTAAAYRFGLRAFGECGGEEGNTSVVAGATPVLDTTALSAAIKVPQSGKKVSGNRVTVIAEIVAGDPGRARDVRFQYRDASSTTTPWLDIPATDAQHPNPETAAPYFVHWDVTVLADGPYELRAVVTATDGTVDPAPGSIVIGVDAVNHDSDESLVGGSQKKDETVYGGAQRTVSLADDASGTVADVTLPSGAVSASTDTLTVQINPPGAPPAPKMESAGQTLQITLGSGQTQLNGSASITLHYADANGDGVVDGTALRAENLAIFSYDVAAGQWRKESASVLNRAAKTITATTPHFSLFGLFSVAAADLAHVLVYPVPWVPGDGIDDNGKPFNASDPASGIVFDGLTNAVRVQVFTVSGSLVWEARTGTSGGRLQWDGRNAAGREVSSGGYIAVITDQGSGAKVVRKLAIIR